MVNLIKGLLIASAIALFILSTTLDSIWFLAGVVAVMGVFGVFYKIREKSQVIEGHKIKVYSGFSNFYIKVDGQVVDSLYLTRKHENYREYTRTGINLHAKLDSGTEVHAHINNLRYIRITTK